MRANEPHAQVNVDTCDEVIFVGANAFTKQAFKHVLHVNLAYLRIYQHYHRTALCC
jgi:hypothetical protein